MALNSFIYKLGTIMTAKDLILQAEEPYRSQMLENANPIVLVCEYSRLSICLGHLFHWELSPQRHQYWWDYENYLIKQGL